MKWHRVRDKFPEHQEEVLIRLDGIFNLAVFNEEHMVFSLRDGSEIPAYRHQLQWLRLGDHQPTT